jgi:hypothetical protein
LSENAQELAGLGYPLEVTIRYGAVEKKISGSPADVAKAALAFLISIIPKLELASRLVWSVDLEQIVKACEGIIAITPEGLVVTVPSENLSDRELLLLHLGKARVAEMMGKSKSDTVQASELIATTKRSSGTVAGRLSELCTEGLAERKGKGEYRVTTLGLHLFQEAILQKLKQNQGGM